MVVGLFDTTENASEAVNELLEEGFLAVGEA